MHENKMERSVRSGGVLKKKSSSGCLIIKKKGDSSNSGGGVGVLSDDTMEKKRVRLVESSSGSSDEDESLELMRRKVNERRLNNGSTGYKRNEPENREYDRINNAGIEVSAEKKRSRLDLFEFDEYDEFDGKMMRNDYLEDRFKAVRRSDKNIKKDFGVGSSNRKKGSYFDGSSSGRNKRVDLEEDETELPISLLRSKYQEAASEPIRLQGKNGVLKVMVNKKKKMGFPSQPKNYDHGDLKKRKRPPSNDLARRENKSLIVDEEREQKKSENGKPYLDRGSSKDRDSEVDGMDTVLKLAPPLPQACSTKKGMKKEKEKTPPPEILTPLETKEMNEGKEGKAKRGGSTEKQMLREKIRGMLIGAGWSIDYRPRRNRDYLDAVYINPTGTAYWSIIKAYDAFKKQLEEDNDGRAKPDVASPSCAPLSEDLVNKLTRQTKKKIEQEMKRKRKEDGVTKIAKKPAVRESSDSDENDERLSSYMKQNNKSRRAKSCKMDRDSDDDMIDDSSRRKNASSLTQGRTSKIIGRCTLLVRGSVKGENSDSDGYVPYRGKRTVLAWLIDCGTARLSEKVQYMNRRRTRVMLEGWITRDGIHCGCCSKILTVSKFELHAGSKLRQPFQNIFLESGSSLLQCQIDAWNSQEESVRMDFHTVDVDGDDPDDDTCGICGDGGDLICCDSCPSTFHQICLEIKMLPSGDWHCPNCTCQFCGFASGNVAKASASNKLHECSFCEKKYHKSCSEKMQAATISSNGASFCGPKCQELYDHLQKNLGVKHELEAGYSWSLIQRTDISDSSLHGFPRRVECNSKLAVALSVMDECFLPIVDRRSGINIIHNVVYNCGSNFKRLNYHGFYTVILERGDEIISAASIRLHGAHLAEMPFIGTREIYRRQGMCRRLFSAIETELRSLKIGQIIIPAISEHMNTWTTVFDFQELEDMHRKEIKSMNMIVFPGTDMLQKQLLKQENSDGFKVSESPNSPRQLPVIEKKFDIRSSMEENGHERETEEENLDPPDSGVSAQDHNISDGSSDPPSKGNTNSTAETIVSNSCKIESPLLESVQDSSGKTHKVSKDSDLSKILNNGCTESPPYLKVNGKPCTESCPTTVVDDNNDSDGSKVDVAEGIVDPTKIKDAKDNDGCDPKKASVANGKINESQNSAPISPSRDADDLEDDKADGRKEVASPIPSSEASAQNAATTDNHVQ